jgi:hypothetical protein
MPLETAETQQAQNHLFLENFFHEAGCWFRSNLKNHHSGGDARAFQRSLAA